MRIRIEESSVTLWLSANDTRGWARRPGKEWPCSQLAGHSMRVEFDSNGVHDYTIDGRFSPQRDVPADEFNAITSDFIRGNLYKAHPVWFVAVGQLEQKG